MQTLKWVLWTWPSPAADRVAYRENLVQFHEVLAETKAPGFLRSGVFTVDTAPWAGAFLFDDSPWTRGDVYEEWYLFDGSAGLDAVNEGTRSGPYTASHAKFFRKDLGGECAGLYYVRNGDPRNAESRITETQFTVWLGKTYPTYDDLVSRLDVPINQGRSLLWRRMLVLGPTPEFHLDLDSPITLPEELKPFWVKRTRIWPR